MRLHRLCRYFRIARAQVKVERPNKEPVNLATAIVLYSRNAVCVRTSTTSLQDPSSTCIHVNCNRLARRTGPCLDLILFLWSRFERQSARMCVYKWRKSTDVTTESTATTTHEFLASLSPVKCLSHLPRLSSSTASLMHIP
jgi:hypothetical protein